MEVELSATFEDLRVLKMAEEIADALWKQIKQWDEFARDVVGKQLARADGASGTRINHQP